jgi:hypothetical protein
MIRPLHWTLIASFMVFVFGPSCSSSSESSQNQNPCLAPAQPNRTSELAQAMRDIDLELQSVLAVLSAGEEATDFRLTEHDFSKLQPTDSTMLVVGFQALSIAFSSHVSNFNHTPSKETYMAVVGGCVSCHQKACPGPLERIAKRRLPDALD